MAIPAGSNQPDGLVAPLDFEILGGAGTALGKTLEIRGGAPCPPLVFGQPSIRFADHPEWRIAPVMERVILDGEGQP